MVPEGIRDVVPAVVTEQIAGTEGTVSEMVRSYGLRRSRYCGTQKNQLQALFEAAAVNLKQLAHCHSLLAFMRSRPQSVPITHIA